MLHLSLPAPHYDFIIISRKFTDLHRLTGDYPQKTPVESFVPCAAKLFGMSYRRFFEQSEKIGHTKMAGHVDLLTSY
jgi:hypothetical protein